MKQKQQPNSTLHHIARLRPAALALLAILTFTAGLCEEPSGERVENPLNWSALTLIITPDWSQRTPGIPVPEEYYFTSDGQLYENEPRTHRLTGATNSVGIKDHSGTRRAVLYTLAEHTELRNWYTIRVEDDAPAPEPSDRFIKNNPGWFFSWNESFEIRTTESRTVSALMKQEVGELTVVIEPVGDLAGRLERIDAFLSGVASQLYILLGKQEDPANVELPFALVTTGSDAGCWAATVRILGTPGWSGGGTGWGEQYLNATLHLNDGTKLPLQSNLTGQLLRFNANKHIPLTLRTTVGHPDTQAGGSAAVGNWIPVTGEGTAE